MAENFPKTQFIGIDQSILIWKNLIYLKNLILGGLAIRSAQLDAKLRNLKNVEFICANACDLDAQWTDKFDMVMVFDSCHDQCRPDIVILILHLHKYSIKIFFNKLVLQLIKIVN